MLKPVLAALALLLLGLTACGSAADNSPASAMPAAIEQSAPSTTVQQERPAPAAQQDPPAAAVPVSGEAVVPQTGLDPAAAPEPGFADDRVEGLVAEWETDLAPISRVAGCVEQSLGLERPLQAEDFQLQANQPAIVACIAKEVGSE